MNSELNLSRVRARQRELDVQAAAQRRRTGQREPASPVTLRLATAADAGALHSLADLDDNARPAEPVLLGEIHQRPLVALSLADGRVVADPFACTHELVDLLRLRARQLGFGGRRARRRYAIRPLLARVTRTSRSARTS